jgi:hypothetical protein
LSERLLPLRVARWFSFQTQNPDFGKIWRALEWKMLYYFMTIRNILRLFGIIYGLLVWFVVIWYMYFYVLVCLAQEKSGNPGVAAAQRAFTKAVA